MTFELLCSRFYDIVFSLIADAGLFNWEFDRINRICLSDGFPKKIGNEYFSSIALKINTE